MESIAPRTRILAYVFIVLALTLALIQTAGAGENQNTAEQNSEHWADRQLRI